MAEIRVSSDMKVVKRYSMSHIYRQRESRAGVRGLDSKIILFPDLDFPFERFTALTISMLLCKDV